MRTLFIIPPFGFRKKDDTIKQKKGFMPPISVALLATILEQDNHQVQILDMQIDNFSEEELTEYIRDVNPLMICLTMLDATAPIVHKIVNNIKLNFPRIITVVGGVHPTMHHAQVLENKNIDYLVHGEAEYTLKELTKALEQNKDIKAVKGLYFRDKNNKNRFTGYRSTLKDLDELPIPSRKYFNLNRYVPTPNQYKNLPATNMITARGCSYSICTFCFESTDYVREKGYRRISVKRAIAEIKYLIEEYGIREIAFWDDEFLMGGRWVEEFCDEIIKQEIKISWSCYGKVNFVRPDRMKKMKRAGCWNIFFGLESGNQELLDHMKKGQNLEMMRNAVKASHDVGIEIRGSFILGLPGETPDMGQKTIDFALSLDLDYGQFNLVAPFAGTEMYEDCKSGKYGTYNDGGDWGKYTTASLIFLPKDYKSPEQLIKLRNKAYRNFYLRPAYWLMKLKSINSIEDLFRYWRGLIFLLEVRLLNRNQ